VVRETGNLIHAVEVPVDRFFSAAVSCRSNILSQTEHSGHEHLCGAVNFRSCEVRSEHVMLAAPVLEMQ